MAVGVTRSACELLTQEHAFFRHSDSALKRRSGVDGAKGSEKKPRNRLRSKKLSISLERGF